jgi:ADP-ribose pyrophosphatase YjhB (NUDIX family)
MKEANPWKFVSTEIVYTNPWIKVHEDRVTTPLGKPGLYSYIESKDSVVVLALNDHDQIYLIRTFVYPSQSWTWQLPGGGGEDEDAAIASRRELEEETGILADRWDKLGQTTVCNGLMTEKQTAYLARDLHMTGEKETSDEPISDGKFVSLEDISSQISRGEFTDGQAITALHLLYIWRQRNL